MSNPEFNVSGRGYAPVPADGQHVGAPVAADPRTSYAQTHPNIAAMPQGGATHQIPTPDQPAVSPAAVSAAVVDPITTEDFIEFAGEYEAHGERVSRIRLREPTGDHIARIGVPVRVVLDDEGQSVEVKFVPQIVNKFIAECSHPPLPLSTVKTLTAWDWQQCAQRIAGFFQPPATNSGR